jgi:NDP-sugar pyrophosphorylase family protein
VIADYARAFATSPLARFADVPWTLTSNAAEIVRALLDELPPDAFDVRGDVAVHRSATVDQGARLQGPLVVGARCFVAYGAFLRGGNWLDADCSVGPGAELKSSFLFAGARLAHFNFVGDSVLGADVNLEAGSIVCNFRNERADGTVRVRVAGALREIDAHKFGALVGDGCRVGANAVLSPGTLLSPGTVVPRGAVVDQELDAD